MTAVVGDSVAPAALYFAVQMDNGRTEPGSSGSPLFRAPAWWWEPSPTGRVGLSLGLPDRPVRGRLRPVFKHLSTRNGLPGESARRRSAARQIQPELHRGQPRRARPARPSSSPRNPPVRRRSSCAPTRPGFRSPRRPAASPPDTRRKSRCRSTRPNWRSRASIPGPSPFSPAPPRRNSST